MRYFGISISFHFWHAYRLFSGVDFPGANISYRPLKPVNVCFSVGIGFCVCYISAYGIDKGRSADGLDKYV
jgi:hypothetical protein